MPSYITKIATILTQFFKELHEMTDWVFTVLMGGPYPSMGGILDISSFHVGTTKMGNRFSQAYPHFSENIMIPYTQFVERIFSEAAVLSRGKGLLPGSTMSSTLVITPEPSSNPDIVVSNTSTPTPANIAVLTSESNLLLTSDLLSESLSQDNDAFYFFSSTDDSLSPMNMGDNTSLPTLPMPPQAHNAIYQVVAPSNPYYPIEPTPASPGIPYYPFKPTFTFPASTPPPNLAHSSTSHIPSGTLPAQTPASGGSSSCMHHNQIPPAVEASPIAPVSTGKHARKP
ncbi:uncharacterized protein F5891DRAFT_1195351 [Suillus fuscotomentosus]|uniref:Uncharacterized protein n=1 Tax=Suillus fuscotomentosus TaxID=1912939 RepID=A0AAD4DUW1_9AGAM|nr:uncharacterized protein F5891DRAFT_1195351 [Suillus fuscotomentosus]KAG1894368.1 hypothetical protein F5891DRAFT_1195351 [Suillus fuscotomentosus]